MAHVPVVALRVGRELGYVALELGCQPSEPSDVVSPARVHERSKIDKNSTRVRSTAVLLRQVHLASQSFLTLYGPGIFYSTHAARAHASAAARMHSSCFHDNDATSTRVCTRVYTAVDLVYSSTCSTRSKFSTSLDHNKWICGFL